MGATTTGMTKVERREIEVAAARHEIARREDNRELQKQGKPKLPAMSNLGRNELDAIVAS
jgi:hypothetical protein